MREAKEGADRFVFGLLAPAAGAGLIIAWTASALLTGENGAAQFAMAAAMAAVVLFRLLFVRSGRSFWFAALTALIMHAALRLGLPAGAEVEPWREMAALGLVLAAGVGPLLLRRIESGGACAAMALAITYVTLARGAGGPGETWLGFAFCLPFIALFARRGHVLEMLIGIALLLQWALPGVRSPEATGGMLALIVVAATFAQTLRRKPRARAARGEPKVKPVRSTDGLPTRALWLVFVGDLVLLGLAVAAVLLMASPFLSDKPLPLVRTVLGGVLALQLLLALRSRRYWPVRAALAGLALFALAISFAADPATVVDNVLSTVFWTVVLIALLFGVSLLLLAHLRGVPNFLKSIYGLLLIFSLWIGGPAAIFVGVRSYSTEATVRAEFAECVDIQERYGQPDDYPFSDEDYALYNRCEAERTAALRAAEPAMPEAARIRPLGQGGILPHPVSLWGSLAMVALAATTMLVLSSRADKTWPPAWRGLVAPRQAVRLRHIVQGGRRLAARFPVADSIAAIVGIWLGLWRHLRGPNAPVNITEMASISAMVMIVFAMSGLPDAVGSAFGFAVGDATVFDPRKYAGPAIQAAAAVVGVGLLSRVRLMTYVGLLALALLAVAAPFLPSQGANLGGAMLLAVALAFFICEALRVALEILRKRAPAHFANRPGETTA